MNFKKFAVGTIPSCWEIKLIDEIKSKDKNAIAMGPFGSRIKSDNFVSSGVPIIRGNNLKKYSFDETDFVFVTEEKAQELKSSIVRKGDLVITHRGTLGQVGIIPENSKYNQYIVSQSGLKISCDLTLVRPEFLYYFLNSRVGQYLLLRNTSQVGVPSIAQPTTSIKQIPVPIPSLIEQNQIVKVLSSIDQKIELNNQMNETLEEMAQALFKRWFVDFEFPNEEGQPYKSSGGEMVESELGMIPKGWEVLKAQDYYNITIGKTPPRKESHWFSTDDKDVKWISISDLGANGTFVTRTNEFLTEDAIKKHNVQVVPAGTVVLSFKLTVGRVAITTEEVATNEAIAHFKKEDDSVREYTYFYLKSFNYESLGNTSSIAKAVNSKIIKSMPILIPNKSIIEKYHSIVFSIFENMKNNKLSNESLIQTRDTLLPKLMSGEIRVSDFES